MSENEEKSAALKAIMQQYKEATTKKPTAKKMDSKERLKLYHSNWIPENEEEGKKVIRILPVKDAEGNEVSPFDKMYVHSVQVEGKWLKLPCPKANHGKDCPFCQARELLYSKVQDDPNNPGEEIDKTEDQIKSDKEIAKKYHTKLMWVLKVIDRENEADGVKFYRFWDNSKKQGIYNKIFDVFDSKGNISSPTAPEGRDITTKIGRSDKGYPTVTSVIHEDPSDLSSDPAQMAAWLEDDRTWTDVYAIKPYEFLAIIVNGGVPKWDTEAKGWADKADLEAEEESDGIEDEVTITADLDAETKTVESAEPAAAQEDDLPF